MVHVPFICGQARRRSPTTEQIDRADVVAVMERRRLARPKRQFGPRLGRARIVCLDLPDRYAFMEPALVARPQPRLDRILGPVA